MRTLTSLWTLAVVLGLALFPPTRYRDRRSATARSFTVPPPRVPEALPEPIADTLPEPEWLDPTETDPARPYVRELERQRGRTATPPPAPRVYGDGLDDVRAELSPLVRLWLSQRRQETPVEVAQ